MSELDPKPIRELFDAEPGNPEASENDRWINLYRELIAMMERQLAETRELAAKAPEPVQQYLGSENIAILEEEIDTFKSRLEHWMNAGASPQ
jgi:TATA-binding protein-associated factor Taf7